MILDKNTFVGVLHTTKTKLFSEVISYQYMFNMYGIF